MPSPTTTPAWEKLKSLYTAQQTIPLSARFEDDPKRFDRYHILSDGLLFDYSKNHIDPAVLSALIDLARTQNVPAWRDRMFQGEIINLSEQRSVLHTALRRPRTDSVLVQGQDVIPDIHHTLDRMADFADAVRNGTWRGHDGAVITDVVNIGIGGSDLGPAMATSALISDKKPNFSVHFVSNIDGFHLYSTLQGLDPKRTLFLIASKTFTTQETMANAYAARDWLMSAHNGDPAVVAAHFIALSTNSAAVTDFGIDPKNMFPFWDWVGGRYSLWSAIGLSLMIQIGPEKFREFLNGGHAMDRHFQTAPLEQNIPVLMALIGVWMTNFYGATSHVVLPYDQRMDRLPAYLQQLDMESNGKSIDRDGAPITYATAPVLFGSAGTNGQHSFYQLLHQGIPVISSDFIAFKHADHPLPGHHQKLLANALAQPQALMMGQNLAEAKGDPNRIFTGNRPSNFFLFDRLTPFTLGQLIAAYEHKIFIQGIIWNINSFDQPGVELGKRLANSLLEQWDSPNVTALDSSTRALMARIKSS